MPGRTRRNLLGLTVTVLLAACGPTVALADVGTSTSSTGQPVAGGWSSNPGNYLGEYHVTPAGASATVPSTPADGLFSLAVRTAAELGTTPSPVSGGQLSVFLRKVKTGEPLVPSGILSISGQDGSQVLYLTDLDVHGTQRVATVNGGSFLGVPIGTLTATSGAGGTLDVVIKATGLNSVHMKLQRYSATPP